MHKDAGYIGHDRRGMEKTTSNALSDMCIGLRRAFLMFQVLSLGLSSPEARLGFSLR